MSYESRAYDKVNDDGFGPDPVVVLVVTGTHDVSRLVGLLASGQPLVEQIALGRKVREQVRRHSGGRAALELLRLHGGPDFTQERTEVDDATLQAAIKRLHAFGYTLLPPGVRGSED